MNVTGEKTRTGEASLRAALAVALCGSLVVVPVIVPSVALAPAQASAAGSYPTTAAVRCAGTVGASDDHAKTTFTFFEDGTLYVQANGAAAGASELAEAFGVSVKRDIGGATRTLVFAEGVTSVSGYDGISCLQDLDQTTCSLTKVVLPASLTAIGDSAFCYQSALKTIVWGSPSHLKVIDEAAFMCCPLTSKVTLPATVSSLGAGAFYGCSNMRSLVIPVGCAYDPVEVVDHRTIRSFTYADGTPAGFTVRGAGAGDARGTYVTGGSKPVKVSNSTGAKALRSLKAVKPRVRRAGRGGLRVSTKRVAGATRYKVHYRVKGTGAWKTVKMAKAKGSSRRVATLKGLKRGKRYAIQVRAYKGKALVYKSKRAVSAKVR